MHSAADLEHHLFGLETRLLEPQTRGDAAALATLLAPDFVEFGSSGRVFDRSSIIAALSGEAPAEYTISEFKLLQLGEGVALVTYRLSRRTGQNTSDSLRSSVWRHVDGIWKMAFHQGTRAIDDSHAF